MLRAIVAGVAGVVAAVAVITGGGQPSGALGCQRSVMIDPQVTVPESGRTLSFTVHTGSCAAAGDVSFVFAAGTAERDIDARWDDGRLQWAAGDTSARQITATIIDDRLAEIPLEDFTVTLINPSADVRVVVWRGQGRIFDNDTWAALVTIDDSACLSTGGGRSPSPQPSPTASPSPSPSPSPSASLSPSAEPSPSPSPLPGSCTIEPGHISYELVVGNEARDTDEYVLFETADGELIAGLDYVPVRRLVRIPAGSTAVHVEIVLLEHAFTQSGGSLHTHISGYTGGGVIDGDAQVTVWS